MNQLTKEQTRDILRQAVTTDTPEADALADWPLHKVLMGVYREYGPDAVTVLLEEVGLNAEMLVDNAQELERRHFPHVATLLRNAAKNAPSKVDDIIEREEPDYIIRLGSDAAEEHKRRNLHYWLTQRMKVTGQSWNAQIKFYGIEDWVELEDADYTLDTNNRVRHIPATNGADSGQ